MMRLAPPSPAEPYEDLPGEVAWFNARCRATGADFTEVALERLEAAGATVEQRGGRVAGIQVGAIVAGHDGRRYVVLAHGTLDPGSQAGLKRSDTVKKLGFDAIMLRRSGALPVLVLTSHLPTGGVVAAHLARLSDDVVDVVATAGDLAGYHRLQVRFGVGRSRPAASPPAWRTPGSQLELFGSIQEDDHA